MGAAPHPGRFPWPLLDTGWTPYPTVLAGTALLAALYLSAAGPLRRRYGWSPAPPPPGDVAMFLAGDAIVLLALVSPLDRLADRYLFSAHMLQHMLLVLAAAPLLVAGSPGWMLAPLLAKKWIRPAAAALSGPVPGFLVFNGTFLLWHLPALYDFALESEGWHAFMHLSFLAAAVVGWWPVLGRVPELRRLATPSKILYLAVSCAPMVLLSAVLVFSPGVLYASYGSAPRVFGLSPLADQQLGGLLMWIPGGLVYAGTAGGLFVRWYGESGRTRERPGHDGRRP
ncbi:MAG: cytochrome c oxidase assembly protein [Gemmatimonadota bacterium]